MKVCPLHFDFPICRWVRGVFSDGEMAPTAPPNMKEDQMLTILHFNDVYNIESGTEEPVGGAARFCTALKSLSHLNPLVLFSGDIFAPSFSNGTKEKLWTLSHLIFVLTYGLSVSTFTKGEQMVPVLNACGVHCSVFGNHDFGKSTLSLIHH